MSRKAFFTKLEVKLILSLIFSFIVSILIFFLINNLGEKLLNNYFNKTSFLLDKKKQAISEFKDYVSDNKLSINDYDSLKSWTGNEKYVDIYLYKDNNLVYTSNLTSEVTNYEQYKEAPIFPTNVLVDIPFIDGNAKLHMECFFEYKYYYILIFFSVFISALLFIILMLFFINKKIGYIGQLENEIKILECGDLNYNISIKSNDELSSLAQSIDDMRKSFIEKLESENEARLANSELITSLSHDLRTPLTALVGYLDIIEYKKYKTNEAFNQYIHNSREKAYQIKYLSDKLFEYFTVFNTSDDLKLEIFNGNELFEQLIQEQILTLGNNGFNFNVDSCDRLFFVELNLVSIRRVFDNIFSNISKYADTSKEVNIKYYIENEKIVITVENKIDTLKRVDSTSIGLKNCKKIIALHKGEFHTLKTDDTFLVKLILKTSPTLNYI